MRSPLALSLMTMEQSKADFLALPVLTGGRPLWGRSATSPVCGSPPASLSTSGSRWHEPQSHVMSKDDREENSHVLTDFFLEELLRTNVTGNSMFHLPDSFQVCQLTKPSHHLWLEHPEAEPCLFNIVTLLLQVSFFSQVMRSQKPILVLMKEYYNLSQVISFTIS